VSVGFAGDAPRLTAAEAFELYQQQGLFAPAGTDVYALAAAAIAAADFRVERVNPRNPAMPAGLDALVWLQPRRSIDKMLEQTVMYLHGGGHVLLAAQPFVMQPRQFPRRDYLTVWWPAPQTPDVDKMGFPASGCSSCARCSSTSCRPARRSRCSWSTPARAATRRQESALPFLLRVSGRQSPTRRSVRGPRRPGPSCVPAYFRLSTRPRWLAAATLRALRSLTCSTAAGATRWKAGSPRPAWLEGRWPRRRRRPAGWARCRWAWT
jgi:hypothetical protein